MSCVLLSDRCSRYHKLYFTNSYRFNHLLLNYLSNMSQSLNLNILVQSVENLSQQVEKNQTVMQQDKISLTKAEALFEGLKGMFNIDEIAMEASGDMILLSTTMNGSKAEFLLDPSQQLKLSDVKVSYFYPLSQFVPE